MVQGSCYSVAIEELQAGISAGHLLLFILSYFSITTVFIVLLLGYQHIPFTAVSDYRVR